MVVSDIIEDAAILFDISLADLRNGRRTRKISAARHALCLALRRRGNELHTIGRWLKIDHTSVIYAEKKAAATEASDPVYALKIRHLVEMKHIDDRLPKPVKKNIVMVPPPLQRLPDTGEKLDYKAAVRSYKDIDRVADQIEFVGGRVHWTLPSIQSVIFSATEAMAKHVGRIPDVVQVTPNAMEELGFA